MPAGEPNPIRSDLICLGIAGYIPTIAAITLRNACMPRMPEYPLCRPLPRLSPKAVQLVHAQQQIYLHPRERVEDRREMKLMSPPPPEFASLLHIRSSFLNSILLPRVSGSSATSLDNSPAHSFPGTLLWAGRLMAAGCSASARALSSTNTAALSCRHTRGCTLADSRPMWRTDPLAWLPCDRSRRSLRRVVLLVFFSFLHFVARSFFLLLAFGCALRRGIGQAGAGGAAAGRLQTVRAVRTANGKRLCIIYRQDQ